MNNRIQNFLGRCGLSNTRITPLAADASSRRYSRVTTPTSSYILMDTDQPDEDIRQFSHIASLLRKVGLSVPIIHQVAPDMGLALLEDFGDGTFTRLLQQGRSESELYTLATDVLIALHLQFRPGKAMAPSLPVYDQKLLLEQVGLFTQIILPDLTSTATASFIKAWARVLPAALQVPQSLLLRDYHVDNLMVLPNRTGVKACGLLDFQLAGLGPVSYDLVSLLEDARRDVSPALAQRMITYYLGAFPTLNPKEFSTSYAVLGALRHTRIIAVFIRQVEKFNKKDYLPFLPRVWKYLDHHLQSEPLTPVKEWFDRHVPLHRRTQ